jgi:iron-sulfur cluster assembly protein
MIELTDRAANQLQWMLEQKKIPDHGLRVFVQGGGCAGLQYGMAFEAEPRAEDRVLQVGRVRLFVDPFSALYLDGVCLDYQETATGGGFRVDNPHAAAVCACGSSFRVEGSREVEKSCEP